MLRFENLKLGCGDHLYIYDGAHDYGRVNIADLSCRNNLANVEPIRTTGNYLTLRYSADKISNLGDGFRLIITAVKSYLHECPYDARCLNQLCISHDLLCDGINHCGDNSDETSHSNCVNPNDLQTIFSFNHLTTQTYLYLLLATIFLIFLICVIVIAIHLFRRENHYANYQHHLQRMVPLQTSSSLMLNQHQILQTSSPYISANCTPQHIPREHYSTLPIHFDRFRQQQQHQQLLQQQQQQQQVQQQSQSSERRLFNGNNATSHFAIGGPIGTSNQIGTPLHATNNYPVVSSSGGNQSGGDQTVKQPPPYNLVFIGPPPAQAHQHQTVLTDASGGSHLVLTTPGAPI